MTSPKTKTVGAVEGGQNRAKGNVGRLGGIRVGVFGSEGGCVSRSLWLGGFFFFFNLVFWRLSLLRAPK